MKPLLFSLFDSSEIARQLQEILQVEAGKVTFHRFPDTEWYLKIDSEVNNRSIIVVDSLNQPDKKYCLCCFLPKRLKNWGLKKSV